ncbi:MAG: RNA polymerase sigma factor [Polyangiales bacterium]
MTVASNEAADRALVEALRAGDEAAFEGFVEAHGAAVLRAVQRHCHTSAVWDDVVQEVWITFLGSLARFEGRSSLRTWLLGIAIHQARNHGRREARSVPLSSLAREEASGDAPSVSRAHFRPDGDRWAGHWAVPPAPWHALGQTPALARELRDRLQQAVDALPPAQREVVVLRDIEGLDGPEVAEALGISEANARVLLHRGRARVRAAVEAYVRGEA